MSAKNRVSDVALVLVDVQEGFREARWGQRNNPDFEGNIKKVLAYARQKSWLIFHVKHASREPFSLLRKGLVGHEFMDCAQPLGGEIVVEKGVNSGFIGTELEAMLRERRVTRLVVGGIATDHCVSTTVRMGANLGFTCFVVEDAAMAFARETHEGRILEAELVHVAALASLKGEFADIVTTAQVLAGLITT